jgi:hypothetical protein
MRPNRVLPIFVVLSLVLCLALVQGCRKERPGFETNLPPETFLTAVPVDSSFVFYRVKLFWGGLDPDGQVVGYYYAMTDSNLSPRESTWTWTTGTEAEFALTANNPQSLGHRFFCKAVDERGLEDPTPSFVFFYAQDTHRPKVRFTKAYAVTPEGETQLLTAATERMLTDSIPGDTIPRNSTVNFAWQGWDEDPGGYVTRYLYKLSTEPVRREGGVADTTFSAVIPKGATYSFEVLAVDDAGATTNTVGGHSDTLRYFVVNYDPDTWIVPPCEGCPKGFFEGGSIPRQEGDTLRLASNLKVSFQWGGWDKDGHVIGWTRRLTRAGGGPAYTATDLGVTSWETASLESGNYEFFVRARDDQIKDDGTPARVKFYVNCAPFFEGEKRCCTCPGGVYETCTLPCTNTIVQLDDGMVYDSLYCAACDVESGIAAEYRTILNGTIGSWRPSPIDILTKQLGLKTGLNAITIEARDRQPDGSIGRTVSVTREFYVDVAIP